MHCANVFPGRAVMAQVMEPNCLDSNLCSVIYMLQSTGEFLTSDFIVFACKMGIAITPYFWLLVPVWSAEHLANSFIQCCVVVKAIKNIMFLWFENYKRRIVHYVYAGSVSLVIQFSRESLDYGGRLGLKPSFTLCWLCGFVKMLQLPMDPRISGIL